MMSSYFSMLNLFRIYQLLLVLVVVNSEVHYYITPSWNISCPYESCLTLSGFAANSSSYLGNETNVSLFFLSGNHTLDREINLLQLHSIVMTKAVQENYGISIKCGNQSASVRFNIRETMFAMIKGLHFIGCGGNRVSQVEQFIVEDSIFIDVKGKYAVLTVNDVIFGKIASVSFFSNTNKHPGSKGIAVNALRSSFTIINSTFANCSAVYGGVIYAMASSFSFFHCAFTENLAFGFGGVFYINVSSFNVNNCTFSINSAIDGGVIIAENSSFFSIVDSRFINNSAKSVRLRSNLVRLSYGGVLCTIGSSFNITNSDFSNNFAVIGHGGILFAQASTFNLIKTTVTNNRAYWGGAIAAVTKSSFNITACTFKHNNGVLYISSFGGVLYAVGSSFNITNSAFNNNSAVSYGGILYAQASTFNLIRNIVINSSSYWGGAIAAFAKSSFNITACTFKHNSGRYGVLYTLSISSFKVNSSTFLANTGGVIRSIHSSFSITNCCIEGNNGQHGGAINAATSYFNIINCSINNNSAVYSGGVLYISDGPVVQSITPLKLTSDEKATIMNSLISRVNIINSSFDSNSALYGGVFHMEVCLFNITNSTFSTNAGAQGGVMYADGTRFNITNSRFVNNSAKRDLEKIMYNGTSLSVVSCGGVFYVFGSHFNIIKSIFSNNSAINVGYGGILYTSSFKIIKTAITNTINSQDLSGNAAFEKPSFINITDFISKNSDTIQFVNKPSFNTITSLLFLTDIGAYDLDLASFNNDTYLAGNGGVICTILSNFSMINNTINNNSADSGGIMYTFNSSFSIISSIFVNNSCTPRKGFSTETEMAPGNSSSGSESAFLPYIGGVIYAVNSSFDINNSKFIKNIAGNGGVMIAVHSSFFSIINCVINDNNAYMFGGAISASETIFSVTNSTFNNNSALIGGVMLVEDSSFHVTNCTFTNNSAAHDRILRTNINNSSYSDNLVSYRGGVIHAESSSSKIIDSTFIMNTADSAGVIDLYNKSSFNITSCIFTENSADFCAVLRLQINANVTINKSIFTHNTANTSTVIQISGGHFIAANSMFSNNVAKHTSVVSTSGSSIFINNCIFEHNVGSFNTLSTNITFTGDIKFENCTGITMSQHQHQGGAIKCLNSNLLFVGEIKLLNNQADLGGALAASGSTITVSGQVVVANNTAISRTGGGIYLEQSEFKVFGNCYISHNRALKGGGMYASSSIISIYQHGLLRFTNNYAEMAGGGLHLDINPRLNLLKYDDGDTILVKFINNHAINGGAIFVADNTSSSCLFTAVPCFMQSLALYETATRFNAVTMTFSGNTATNRGADLYGGLLDRCIASPFAEIYKMSLIQLLGGVPYLGIISNIESVDSLSSLPVRVCFCNYSVREPNCNYQPPLIRVMKGEAFNVSLVAVDQVNYPVAAYINSSLAHPGGGFREGQQSQKVTSNCTDLTFNIFSLVDTEILTLFPDGPCGSATPSTKHLNIQFLNCTCPIGFEPSNNKPTTCECTCDSALYLYISECNATTKMLVRENANSWISYFNDTDSPGYIIYSNCPFDYCYSPAEQVYFSLPDQVDGQCAYNRTGLLCGACQPNFSLSLGSSLCLPCNNRHWLTALITILIGSAIIGILLVIMLLVLNITVTGGFISGIIFYANIVAASKSVLIPSADPSFPSVLVAWLNLDIGFDLCFFDGLDTYTKTWFQLAFPAYIISLVIIVIKVSEHSPKFTRLLAPGRRDPVATLATLTLLSSSKLLSTTIAALSYAELHYPDGSRVKVWLPDGNVQYLRGKHIVLAVAAFLIILVGVPYTLLLFSWQWLIRSPNSKLFKWTRDTRLNAIITTYHAPYNYKHRYWTGLLLLVRVVLYITAALFLSGNPQIPLLVTNILIGGLFFLKSIIGIRLYNVLVIDVMETVTLLNILCLSTFSLYKFKRDNKTQTAAAYTSTSITLLMLVGGIIYHIALLIKRLKKTRVNVEDYALLPLNEPAATASTTEVTYSIVERPTPEPPPTPPHSSSDTDSDSISLYIENNDCQSESSPCECYATYPADKDKEDTVPLLEKCPETM